VFLVLGGSSAAFTMPTLYVSGVGEFDFFFSLILWVGVCSWLLAQTLSFVRRR
jgi:hypothetical protein